MSDADCTPGREPRSVAASGFFILYMQQTSVDISNVVTVKQVA